MRLPHPLLLAAALVLLYAAGLAIGEAIAGPRHLANTPIPQDSQGNYQLWTEKK